MLDYSHYMQPELQGENDVGCALADLVLLAQW